MIAQLNRNTMKNNLIKITNTYRSGFISLILISLLIILSGVYSCGSNMYSVQDDVTLGEEIDQQIKSDQKQFPVLQGHKEVKDYISGLGNYVLNNSPYIKYKNVFPYKFDVIHDDSTVNAFCIPGGYIYIYTGLIKFLDNEAALIGVIGHEIAHAERRHMTQRLTSYYGVSLILGLVLGNNPNILGQIAANLFVGLGFLANSRADEEDADNYAINYLKNTKYYPGGILNFFSKIKEEQRVKGQTPGDLERLLATHPLPADRIENVNNRLKKLNPRPDSTKGLFKNEYQLFKQKLPK